MARTRKNGKRKGKLKWIIIAIVVIIILAAAGNSKQDKKSSDSSKNTSQQVTETPSDNTQSTEMPATEKETEVPATEKVTELPSTEKETEAPSTEKDNEEISTEIVTETMLNMNPGVEELKFEIIAGEIGDYGQELVLGEGTEFEDRIIGHFVPSGTYRITNIGEYPTQVNVYKNEKNITTEGWEEWADGLSERLDVDATVEMVVEDGYFINVDEPTHISLEKTE